MPIRQLNKVTAIIWNSGSSVIEAADFIKADPLRIEVKGNEILDAKITQQTSPHLGCKIEMERNIGESKNMSAAKIHFDYLQHNDGFIAEVLYSFDSKEESTSKSQNQESESHSRKYGIQKSPGVVGTVKGIKDGPNPLPWNTNSSFKKNAIWLLFLVLLSLFFSGFVAYIGFDFYFNLDDTLAAIIYWIFSAAAFLFSILGFLTVYALYKFRPPKNLGRDIE